MLRTCIIHHLKNHNNIYNYVTHALSKLGHCESKNIFIQRNIVLIFLFENPIKNLLNISNNRFELPNVRRMAKVYFGIRESKIKHFTKRQIYLDAL